ncbi:MAG: general secretion pathway protein GspD [Pseudomonadota bacterium]|nr:general secretion pathway protein GspD [Pseudomonadota bacterium]
MLAICTLLGGCAAQQAFDDGDRLVAKGQYEPGLAKLGEAAQLEPQNAQYRLALVSRRSAIVERLVAAGDRARRDGRFDDAESAYRRAASIDPDSVMASQGLQAAAEGKKRLETVDEAERLVSQGSPSDLALASDKLQSVLREEPDQKRALELKARVDDMRAHAQNVGSRLALAFRKPIALQFSDTPLRAAFDFVSQASGLNFIFDTEVRPDLKVTMSVKDTSVEDAVHLMLATSQLEQRVLNTNTILIYPNTPQKLRDYQALSIRTFYVSNADVKAVSNTLKTLAKLRDIVVDEKLGLIMVRDTPDAIRVAERLVALQDQAEPEVMLELEVLEVDRSRLVELGVEWPSQLSLSPLTAANQPLTLSQLAHLKPSTTQAVIGNLNVNANATDGDSNILANPRIRVRNKEKAKILIGDRVPVITTTSTATGFVADSVSYLDVGLKLEAEPTIYLDNDVAIRVNLEVSSITSQNTAKDGTVTYQLGTRNASTVLRLRDGQTQILAGLINEQDTASANKIPFLGDVPLLGRLFGSTRSNKARTEILLSITPHVVRSLHRASLSDSDFDSGTEAIPGNGALQLAPSDPASTPGAAMPTSTPMPTPAPAQAPAIVIAPAPSSP